jgi:hypothetical protein
VCRSCGRTHSGFGQGADDSSLLHHRGRLCGRGGYSSSPQAGLLCVCVCVLFSPLPVLCCPWYALCSLAFLFAVHSFFPITSMLSTPLVIDPVLSSGVLSHSLTDFLQPPSSFNTHTHTHTLLRTTLHHLSFGPLSLLRTTLVCALECTQTDWPHRTAGSPHHRTESAENSIGQDHASYSQKDRREENQPRGSR